MHGRRRSFSMRAYQSGYGLLEIALGLFLVSAILTSVALFFEKASASERSSDTIQQIVVMSSLMDRFRQNMPPSDSDLMSEDYTQTFRDMGLFPAKWTREIDPPATTPFRTPLMIVASTQKSSQSFYVIALPDLPEAGCEAILLHDYGQSLQYMYVKPSTDSAPGYINKRMGTPSEADEYCKGGVAWLQLRFLG